jgi:hypothetical protein
MLTEFLLASSSRQRNTLAASSRLGTAHTRQSKSASEPAFSGMAAARCALKYAVVIDARIEVSFCTRRSRKDCAPGSSSCHTRLISSDWV